MKRTNCEQAPFAWMMTFVGMGMGFGAIFASLTSPERVASIGFLIFVCAYLFVLGRLSR